MFSWIHNFFTMNDYNSQLVHTTMVECLTSIQILILRKLAYYAIYGYSIPYITLLTLAFMQCEVQSSCFECTCLFISQKLYLPAQIRPDNIHVRQVCIATSFISSYHALLFSCYQYKKNMDCKCTRRGSEVCTYTVLLPVYIV